MAPRCERGRHRGADALARATPHPVAGRRAALGGGGRQGAFCVLSALAELPKRPALSATIHDPERIVWRPVSALWRALDNSAWVPSLFSKILAVLFDPHTLW